MGNNCECPRSLSSWESLGQTLLSILLFALIFLQGVRYHMPENGFCMRTTCYAIPIALSALLHNHPYDYTGYKDIGQEFFEDYNTLYLLNLRSKKTPDFSWQTKKNLDRHFEYAFNYEPHGGENSWTYAFDDKGQIDYAYLSFLLLGTKPESLFYFFMFLLFGACLFYFVCFFEDSSDLFWLNCYLCAVYSVIFLIITEPQLASFHQPRCFDLLSFIPMMHIVLLMWKRKAHTLRAVLTTVLQLSVFILLYHARSSISWQVLCMFFCAVWVLFGDWRRGRTSPGRIGMESFRRALSAAWPCLLLVLSLISLNIYKHASYHEIYYKGSLPGRLMWHNILMGFNSNPNLSLIGEGSGDRWSYRATNNFYNRHHLSESMGEYNLVTNLALHEKLCKKMVFEILYWYPLEFVKTFVWYKPLTFWQQLSNFGGSRPILISSQNPMHDPSAASTLRYNPFRLEILFLLLVVSLISAADVRMNIRHYLLLSIVFLVFSLVPMIVVYPVSFLTVFNLQYLQLVLYGLISLTVVQVYRGVQYQIGSAETAETFAGADG